MPSPLESLVQGLQENRENQQKKAKEVAALQSQKFEQQFRLDQAKQQAQHQAAQLADETERTRIDNFRALMDANAKKEIEKQKERQNKIAEATLEYKYAALQGGFDFKDNKAIREALLKKQAEYEKGGISPQEAASMAQQALVDAQTAVQEHGAGALPQQGSQQPSQGESVLDMLNRLGAGQAGAGGHPHTVTAPSETPEAMNKPLPSVDQALKLKQQQQQTSKASEEHLKSLTLINNGIADSSKALAEAKVKAEQALSEQRKAGTAKTRAETAIIPATSKAHIAEMNALAAYHLNQIGLANKKLTLDLEDHDLAKIEAGLKRAETKQKTADATRSEILRYSNEKDRLGNEKDKLVKSMSEAELVIRPGYLESQTNPHTQKPYTPQEAKLLRDSTGKHFAEQGRRLNEITFLQRLTDREVNEMETMLLESRANTLTGDNGKPDPKKTEEAIRANKDKTARLNKEIDDLKKQEEARQKRDAAVSAPSGPLAPAIPQGISAIVRQGLQRQQELKDKGVYRSNPVVHKPGRRKATTKKPAIKTLKLRNGKEFHIERID